MRETTAFTIATNNTKYPGVTNQTSEGFVGQQLQVSQKRIQRSQKIKRSHTLVDWKNQHSKNGHLTKENL